MARTSSGDNVGGSVRHAFPGFRVFIFGLEVTKDVLSINVTAHDGKSPNSCNITLASKLDKYIITDDDIGYISLVAKKKSDTVMQSLDKSVAAMMQSKQTISKQELKALWGKHISKIKTSSPPASDITRSVRESDELYGSKYRVINKKISVPAVVIPPDTFEGDPSATRSASYNFVAERYPYQAGKPIFHPMDPVRVFARDPFNPTEWYWLFSGTVSDFTDETGVNQEKTLTLTIEDPSKLLRYGRFTSNAGLFDISQMAIRDAIVSDIAVSNTSQNMFDGMTLPQIFSTMMFGGARFGTNAIATVKEPIISANSDKPMDVSRRKYGIGHTNMKQSRIFMLGRDSSTAKDKGKSGLPSELNGPGQVQYGDDILFKYQDAISNQVRYSDLEILKADGLSYAPANPIDPTDIKAIITEIGSHPEVYPVDGGRLMMLLPPGMDETRQIVQHDLIQTFNLNTEWTTRGEVLYEIVSRIEFVFYVTPRGDFCVEFPLYDFMPEDFNSKVNQSAVRHGDFYNIRKCDTVSTGSAFSDSKVMTQMTAVAQAVQNWGFGNNISNQIRRDTVTLWHLIPLFGVRTAPITPKGYIASFEAARLYAHIALNKMNCDTYTMNVQAMPNLNVGINRPLLITTKSHVATVKSFAHSIVWGKSGQQTTTYDLHAARGWSGDMNGEERVYDPIGGSGSRPFNYATLFNYNAKSQKQNTPKTGNGKQGTPVTKPGGPRNRGQR